MSASGLGRLRQAGNDIHKQGTCTSFTALQRLLVALRAGDYDQHARLLRGSQRPAGARERAERERITLPQKAVLLVLTARG